MVGAMTRWFRRSGLRSVDRNHSGHSDARPSASIRSSSAAPYFSELAVPTNPNSLSSRATASRRLSRSGCVNTRGCALASTTAIRPGERFSTMLRRKAHSVALSGFHCLGDVTRVVNTARLDRTSEHSLEGCRVSLQLRDRDLAKVASQHRHRTPAEDLHDRGVGIARLVESTRARRP